MLDTKRVGIKIAALRKGVGYVRASVYSRSGTGENICSVRAALHRIFVEILHDNGKNVVLYACG